MVATRKTFIQELRSCAAEEPICLRGWIYRLRELAKNTFVVLRDCSGEIQCIGEPEALASHLLKLDDAIEVMGTLKPEPRARLGYEIQIKSVCVLNRSAHDLPFNACKDLDEVGQEVLVRHRPLSLRNEAVGAIFRIKAAILEYFREFLTDNRFTEIVSSKIVASGTEGGTNLFEIRYFDRIAYLAQSPQFYKEEAVAGLERVFETGHVYRAEPHATSRHLTEYYSLDFEMGFIDGVDDVIQMERELLTHVFARLNGRNSRELQMHGQQELPSMLCVPCWEFDHCLWLLEQEFGRKDLFDDLDPLAERQLCQLAERVAQVPAVFVVGFPLSARPFYTAPRGTGGAANSFDLLFRGVEITTGGQRLHERRQLEAALTERGQDPKGFEHHLRAFDLGMPPHGGLAIGLERLTAQILGLKNVREAVLYPRDRHTVVP